MVKVHHHQGLNGFHYVDEGNQSMDTGGEMVRRREGREKRDPKKEGISQKDKLKKERKKEKENI